MPRRGHPPLDRPVVNSVLQRQLRAGFCKFFWAKEKHLLLFDSEERERCVECFMPRRRAFQGGAVPKLSIAQEAS